MSTRSRLSAPLARGDRDTRRSIRLWLLAAAMLAVAQPAASLSVITFETLPGDGSSIPDGYGSSPADGSGIPAGFGGFRWSPPPGMDGESIAAVDWTRFEGVLNPPGDPTGFVTGATSGTTTAFNSVSVGASGMAYITLIPKPRFETFDFVQAAWTGGFGPQTLTLDGRLAGTTLFTTSFGVARGGSFVSRLDWKGIDQLAIHSSVADAQWVVDDLTFRSGPPPIPEPSTLALIAAGLALLAARVTRRRR